MAALAKKGPNISAQHEGGVPEVDSTREHLCCGRMGSSYSITYEWMELI
jgi:hypothetical protein